MSRCSRPALCTADDRPAELEADLHLSATVGSCRLLEDLLQGVAANELHPEANLVADLLGAINGDHVGVAHAGEQPALRG